MKQHFIQNILIKEVRNIKNLEIPLSSDKRKHLIITGKNGSGKTSMLVEINSLLNEIFNNEFSIIRQNLRNIENSKNAIVLFQENLESFEKDLRIVQNFEESIERCEEDIVEARAKIGFLKIECTFSTKNQVYEYSEDNKFILKFFEAKRNFNLDIPNTPIKQEFQKKYNSNFELNQTFLQYMLNLKTAQAFAQIRNDNNEAENIAKWFDTFENSLKTIFDEDELKFIFYDKEYTFKIEYNNKSFGLNELSDGYSSLLGILTELILRMEAHNVKAYDMQGVVLIDEIETHLHIELQKKILPFLVSFFPKIQFIVTTHSPFVLSSLANAVVCDLEKKLVIEDLSEASYSGLVRNYFGLSSEYSILLEKKFKEFETLVKRERLTEIEEDRLIELDVEFSNITPLFSSELYAKYITLRKAFLV